MAYPYYFKTGAGDDLLPVADAAHIIDDMSASYGTGQISVEFLDAQGDPVAGTAGTVTFSSSPNGSQWHTPSNGDGVINVVDVIPEAEYTIPEFNGPVVSTRMVLSGVAGATFVRAFHWRDDK